MFVKTLATVLFRHGLSGSKQFVEASVADLVSLYEGNDQARIVHSRLHLSDRHLTGESATKTQKKINEARGCVLYINDMHLMASSIHSRSVSNSMSHCPHEKVHCCEQADCGPAAKESIGVILRALNRGEAFFFFGGEQVRLLAWRVDLPIAYRHVRACQEGLSRFLEEELDVGRRTPFRLQVVPGSVRSIQRCATITAYCAVRRAQLCATLQDALHGDR